jgi:hypothetical protein
MRNLRGCFLFTLALLVCSNAWSYRVGKFRDQAEANSSEVVHIFVMGYSHGMGDQFTTSAVTRALKYRELYPTHKSIFIKNSEAGTWSSRLDVVKDASDTPLDGALLVRIMDKFEKIASIDFYGHSSPLTGFGLEPDSLMGRLRVSPDWMPESPQTPNLSILSDGNFLPNAYVTINGCNSGYVLAPKLSKIWKVPVQSALTSTDFQELHTNSEYYFNNSGEYPSGGWADTNESFFSTEKDCSGGGCIRMKPINAPYSGTWGKLGGGLQFYKNFCNFDISDDDCAKRVAPILLAYPSAHNLPLITAQSSRADYEQVVVDFLCPISINSNIREQCTRALRDSVSSGNEIYSSMGTKSLQCTLKGCDSKISCQYDSDHSAISGTCSSPAPNNQNPTTTIREYKLYLKGFDLLSKL